MKVIELSEFKSYIDSLKVTRTVKRIQLHHTYSPSYKQFTGSNHIALQNGMRDYHIKTKGYADIAQQFTIFPDGKICTGRDINTAPAGIYGANSTGICIECLGNFDKGGDEMSDVQKNAIVGVVKILLDKFGLDAKTGVTYHAWWTSSGEALGTYVAGKSAKTCPGTNFFGGNSKEAFEKNLLLLLEAEEREDNKQKEIMEIVEKLSAEGVLSDTKLWIKKCAEDVNVYWLCKKMVSKLVGRL